MFVFAVDNLYYENDHSHSLRTDADRERHISNVAYRIQSRQLSALLSVSSYTKFLNDGRRNNCGEIANKKNKIEENGIIIGLVGARLKKKGFMEFQDIVIHKTQNTVENGYGLKQSSGSNDSKVMKNFDFRQMWNEFYEEQGTLFVNVKKNGKRFGDALHNDVFDNVMMKKRFTISFDTLLLESETRAQAANKRAYIHVVGIGLGVWRIAPQQEQIFLETFAQRIRHLMSKLKHISFIHFSWFKLDHCGDVRHGNCFPSEEHPDGGIRIFISNRNPADKLPTPEFENTLLVVSYAWDGNALPGNEFWMGKLCSSGDPAAACSSLIAELHNAHINKTMVSGENLHIASPNYGIIHIADYAKKTKNSK